MARISILMYHIIDKPQAEQEAKFCCDPAQFAKQMQYLASSNYTLLNLNDISLILEGKKELNSDSIAVTFDDGFEDFYHNARPIIKHFKIPTTLFMVSNRIGQHNDWMVKKGSPKRNLLSANQLQELLELDIVIGSHTRSHPKLNEISYNPGQLNQEINDSKIELEQALGISVNHFAYPYGLFDSPTIDFVKQSGYKTACSTRSGFNRLDIDPFLLRRIEVYGSDRLWHFKQKIKFGTNDMTTLFPIKYYLSQAKSKFITQG